MSCGLGAITIGLTHSETFSIMSQSIPTGYIPPGEIFLSERIPATRAIFLSNSPAPGQNDGRIPGVGQNFPELEETAP